MTETPVHAGLKQRGMHRRGQAAGAAQVLSPPLLSHSVGDPFSCSRWRKEGRAFQTGEAVRKPVWLECREQDGERHGRCR